MGGSSSKNTSSTINQIVNSVITSSIQNCATGISANQIASIVGNNGTTVNLGDVNWSQAATVDAQCLQSSSVQNTMSTNLQNQLQQFATSESTIAALSSSQTANVVNLTNSLANEVVNQFNKNCSTPTSLTQLLQIQYNNGTVVNAASLNWSQTTQSIVNCVQNDQVYTNLQNQISNAVSQTSKSKIDSLLASIFGSLTNFIILIVVIIVIIIIIIIIFAVVRRNKQKQQQQSGGNSNATQSALMLTPQGRALALTGAV